MPQFAPKPTYNPTANALVANQRLVVGAAAVAFAAFNANTTLVGLEIQTANVYVTFDGTTPSSTNGNTLYAAQTYHWDVYTAQSAKFIQVSAAAAIMAIELAGVIGQTIPPITDVIKSAPWGTGVGTFTSLTVSGTSILTGAVSMGSTLSVTGSITGTGSINVGTNSITGGAISGTTGGFTGKLTVSGISGELAKLSANVDLTGSNSDYLAYYGTNSGALSGYVGFGGTAATMDLYNAIGPITVNSVTSTVAVKTVNAFVATFSSTGLAVTGTVDINGVAASATAGHIQLGSSTQSTIGANGAASALTANPLGYLIAYLGATKIVIPYYNG